jgi:hypothetical protein
LRWRIFVGTDLAEDTALEADGDSEEDIGHERDTGQLANRKEPRTGVDLHMEAGRTLYAFSGDIRGEICLDIMGKNREHLKSNVTKDAHRDLA